VESLLRRLLEVIGSAFGQFSRREKLLLLAGTILSYAAFWYAGNVFRIPVYAHFSSSLLQQSTHVTTLLVTGIVYLVSMAVALLIAGRVGSDAGLFCTSLGLAALSIRGGAMRFTLQAANNQNVWLMLFWELLILGGFVIGGFVLEKLLGKSSLVRDEPLPQTPSPINDLGRKTIALAANVLLMAMFLWLFAASDRKGQCILAVAISSFLATVMTYAVLPVHPSYWYWPATFIVGAIGYLFAYSGNAVGWQIGQIQGGWTVALARPLPLDYASVGVAASLFAYWAGRRWESHLELDTVPEGAG
jgi:hypothetical protein